MGLCITTKRAFFAKQTARISTPNGLSETLLFSLLTEYRKQESCRNCRADNARNIRSHSVHEEEV